MRTKPHETAAPLGTATEGRLEIAHGGARLTLTSQAETTELYRARFEGTTPMVLTHDGRVTIEYPRLSPAEWLRTHRRAAEIALNPSLPWMLLFGGGVSGLRADLRPLTLRLLEIGGGASDVEVLLPQPHGLVQVRVAGGSSATRFARPSGSAARIRIAGGATRLSFDDQRLGAIGGETHLASARADQAADRYEIEIGGGASALTIGAWDDPGDER
jgi:hypothetical protein